MRLSLSLATIAIGLASSFALPTIDFPIYVAPVLWSGREAPCECRANIDHLANQVTAYVPTPRRVPP